MPYKFLDSKPVPAGVEANLWFDAYNSADSRIRKQHRHHPTSELRRSVSSVMQLSMTPLKRAI
jgi:hypothetical protein